MQYRLTGRVPGPDNVGGRTRAILFDKRDATFNTVYAASVAGGIWKSTNLGSTWVKVNQANSNLNVSCMAQTPIITTFMLELVNMGFHRVRVYMFRPMGTISVWFLEQCLPW